MFIYNESNQSSTQPHFKRQIYLELGQLTLQLTTLTLDKS